MVTFLVAIHAPYQSKAPGPGAQIAVRLRLTALYASLFLLEQARDENADPFGNAVFVTLSRLRRKLGDPPVIRTQPGVGYHITG
jgi:hypothetical protein